MRIRAAFRNGFKLILIARCWPSQVPHREPRGVVHAREELVRRAACTGEHRGPGPRDGGSSGVTEDRSSVLSTQQCLSTCYFCIELCLNFRTFQYIQLAFSDFFQCMWGCFSTAFVNLGLRCIVCAVQNPVPRYRS